MTTYYFSTSGSNSNSGTSTGSPLYNLAGAPGASGGGISYSSPDTYLFKKGDVWPAQSLTLFFPSTSGIDGVTIGTYGSGAAPVYPAMLQFYASYSVNAINNWSCDGIDFGDLSGATTNGITFNGTTVSVTGVSITNCKNGTLALGTSTVTIASATVTGNTNCLYSMTRVTSGSITFTGNTGGMQVGSTTAGSASGSRTWTLAQGTTRTQALINRCTSHNITFTSYAATATSYASMIQATTCTITGGNYISGALDTCTSCTIAQAAFLGPTSGDGIAVFNGSGNTVDQCYVGQSGYLSTAFPGYAGIHFQNTSSPTITRCAVTGAKAGASAGDGILVENCASATVTYNLVWNCDGAGIHLYGNPFTSSAGSAVVRYNITWHNCQGSDYYGELTVSHWVSASSIYNNTHIAADYGASTPAAVLIRGKSAATVTVRNCILTSQSGPLVLAVANAQTTSQVLFQGCGYYRAGGFNVQWGPSTVYSSLSSWQTATSQEKNGASLYGTDADPLFVDAVTIPAVTQPWTSLSGANGLKLSSSSPYKTNGLNLNSLFGTSIGTRDYFGTTLSNPWSVGGAEF